MRNYKEHRLSKTDQQIMDYFWNSGKEDIMARDVLQYFYKQGKTWNQQNVSCYLKNLQKIGMLRAEVRNGKYYYYPTMTKQEYRLLPTRNIIAEDFAGSYSDFFMAIVPTSSRTELERLKKLVAEYEKTLSSND